MWTSIPLMSSPNFLTKSPAFPAENVALLQQSELSHRYFQAHYHHYSFAPRIPQMPAALRQNLARLHTTSQELSLQQRTITSPQLQPQLTHCPELDIRRFQKRSKQNLQPLRATTFAYLVIGSPMFPCTCSSTYQPILIFIKQL